MKKEKKILFILLGIAIIVLIGILITSFFGKKDDSHKSKDVNIKYSSEAKTVMKEYNVTDEIASKSYSKTVDKMLSNKEFKKEYLQDYYAINYQEKDDFLKSVNTFLDKNYSAEEINNIFEYLNEKNIELLKQSDYIELNDYVKISNMEVNKISRYKSYQEQNKLDAQTAVTYVNIGLDQEFYSEITEIKNPNSITLLLNKYRALPEDYEPQDLVSLSYSNSYKMRKEAAEHFEQMVSAALLDNIRILPYSPYRGKDRQQKLYNNYVARDGKKAADTYSARPRHSEHETGLTVDVRSPELNDNLNKEAYKWVQENGHKYGYIIRYPEGTTPITGFVVEPWHLRYIGIEAATGVHEKNITFDEYYDLYLKEKEEA